MMPTLKRRKECEADAVMIMCDPIANLKIPVLVM
jgi:hypothetical protein